MTPPVVLKPAWSVRRQPDHANADEVIMVSCPHASVTLAASEDLVLEAMHRVASTLTALCQCGDARAAAHYLTAGDGRAVEDGGNG